MLIGLPYRHLCWERAETSNEQNAAQCLPCLFLQFPVSAVKGRETSTDTQVFQIFSREVSRKLEFVLCCDELMEILSFLLSSCYALLTRPLPHNLRQDQGHGLQGQNHKPEDIQHNNARPFNRNKQYISQSTSQKCYEFVRWTYCHTPKGSSCTGSSLNGKCVKSG